MTTRRRRGREPHVGMFGLLGSGNLGNDASLQVVVDHVRRCAPAAAIDAMCSGPERLEREWAIPAVPILWSHRFEGRELGRGRMMLLRLAGLVVDPFRVAAWVRRHDLVVVPGMGVLEASLPLHPWGVPYSMLLLCASGRILGTPVALVSVGANDTDHRLTRTLFNLAARLATYRSYRDPASREAMRRRGLDVEGDPVYPDLVFGMANPAGAQDAGRDGTVGVGVMAYFGGNDDRREATDIHARYVSAMVGLVEWLVGSGRSVRLFWGDDVDAPVAREIARAVRDGRPEAVVAEEFGSLKELMEEMAQVDLVVATRFHNVLSALKLAKPTISVGYSRKFDELMASMGQSDFARSARNTTAEELIRDFQELERRSPRIREVLRERRGAMAAGVERQLAEVSALITPSGGGAMWERSRAGRRDRGRRWVGTIR